MSLVIAPLLRLKGFFSEVLHPRFVRWTRPLTRSLPLGTRLDLGRSKSELIAETIALIREMAAKNRLWGAERIRGELLKLDMHVSKRTIQKYMRHVRTLQPRGQKWTTDLAQSRGRYLGLRRAFRSPISSFDRFSPSSLSSSRHDG
jgi:hypothetical protein